MKKLILSAIAATLVASPLAVGAAEAAPQQHGRIVVTERTTVRNAGPRAWHAGEHFDRRRAANYRIVNDYRTYRLAPPPRGHHWARSGNDAVLVRDNGIVVRVIQRAFG